MIDMEDFILNKCIRKATKKLELGKTGFAQVMNTDYNDCVERHFEIFKPVIDVR